MSANIRAALTVLDGRVDRLRARLEAIEKRRVAAKNPQWGAYEYDAVAEEMEALKFVLGIARTSGAPT